MSFVDLASFVTVAEEGHLGRAAKRLRVSQPPLTRRIRRLESELGVTLFERTSRGMRLRPEGHRLLPQARAILHQVERTRAMFAHQADSATQIDTSSLCSDETSPTKARSIT